jgi:glycosyltransferase involved in cell wall biosynthesis
MRISGFSFVRNGIKLYYPVVESIQSILPICDEFIIAVGKGDPDDTTREAIENIGSDKIRIIDTVWDQKKSHGGYVHGVQTNIALKECTGDWCFYVQSDEVVHEKYLEPIRERCAALLDDREVEGLLFGYKHFWGDYWHYHDSRAWYRHEIRIIRNGIGVESRRSAQSFRKGDQKIQVAMVDAEIYHYGWVRPPHFMQTKSKVFHSIHYGKESAEALYEGAPERFDYRPLDGLPTFTETHPKVMEGKIKEFDWGEELKGDPGPNRELQKHERLKYRFLTFLDKHVPPLRGIGEYQNWHVLKDR